MNGLCPSCYLTGYCREKTTYAVAEEELTPAFLADARNFAFEISRERDLSAGQWPDFLVDGLRDYPGLILDPKTGREMMLEFDLLFPSDPMDEDGWYDYRDETDY